MKITQVKVRKIQEATAPRLRGYAQITIDDCFVVHDIKIIESERGLFLAMPSKKDGNGNHRDLAHPINSETREMIQKVVLDEYNKEDKED